MFYTRIVYPCGGCDPAYNNHSLHLPGSNPSIKKTLTSSSFSDKGKQQSEADVAFYVRTKQCTRHTNSRNGDFSLHTFFVLLS